MAGPQPPTFQLCPLRARDTLRHVLHRVERPIPRGLRRPIVGKPNMYNLSEPRVHRRTAQSRQIEDLPADNHNVSVNVPSVLLGVLRPHPLHGRDPVPLVLLGKRPSPEPQSVEPLDQLEARFAGGQRDHGDLGNTTQSTVDRLPRPSAQKLPASGTEPREPVGDAAPTDQPTVVVFIQVRGPL